MATRVLPAQAPDSAAATDPVTERILDAALEQFQEIGIEKTTIEDIAKRAGVGRMTVFRKMGSKDAIISAVVSREARHLFECMAEITQRPISLDDRIVAATSELIHRIRSNRLFQRLLYLDAEATLPKITIEGSDVLAAAIAGAIGYLQTDVDAGRLDAENLPLRIEAVARIIHSIALTPHAVAPLTSDAELEQFARVAILPIMLPGTPR
ncbi:helix-turn-helix domain-containing protein [Nocardia sp. NPDC052001]|uniref:TetR/AcrR family transcriptional regulator n=1 Tax=Nocardia sp. NPDC052001 TaxID=3154853 RepID=UPI003433813F